MTGNFRNIFIMSLLLFESFPDPGYTTNCTITGNRGQKCPEIEDKKRKRDMIKIFLKFPVISVKKKWSVTAAGTYL